MAGIFEQIILGVVQGIAEWLPISSEGMIFLVKNNFFPGTGFEETIKLALFLHLGTFFAALIYLRKDVWRIIKTLFKYDPAKREDKKLLGFMIIATLISGIFGILLIKFIASSVNILTGRIINAGIGLLLLVTGYLELKSRTDGVKKNKDLTRNDSIALGFAQGTAVLPGLSRSGLTVSAFLLRRFDKTTALKLSFLLSLPIVLIGNILWNFKDLSLISEMAYGMVIAFVFGLLTIHGLIKLSKKINFGYFVGGFGILMILASLL